MKTLLTFIITLLVFTGSASAVDFDQQDKQYHMAGTYALTASGSMLLRKQFKMSTWESALYGTLGALAVGLAKEYTVDRKPDSQDLEANLLGAGAGVASTLLVFEF